MLKKIKNLIDDRYIIQTKIVTVHLGSGFAVKLNGAGGGLLYSPAKRDNSVVFPEWEAS